MRARPDQFPKIGAKQAASPDAARLFDELAHRADTFAQMQDKSTESITKHREAREGRPVHLTKSDQRLMAEFGADADKVVQDMRDHVGSMDDTALLVCALSGVHQQMDVDERMFSGWPDEDKPAARRLIDYERETLRLIQQFILKPWPTIATEMVSS